MAKNMLNFSIFVDIGNNFFVMQPNVKYSYTEPNKF